MLISECCFANRSKAKSANIRATGFRRIPYFALPYWLLGGITLANGQEAEGSNPTFNDGAKKTEAAEPIEKTETPYERQRAAFNQIVAEEKALVAELRQLEAKATEIEKRLTQAPPAAREVRSPAEKAQAARVRRLSNAIRATLKGRFRNSLDVVQLETEAKILRDIFDEITDGITSTSVGLRFAEVAMKQLAKGGAVKPHRTRFRTIYQLRNAIANARQALGTARKKEKRRKAALDRKLESLDRRLEEALHADVPSSSGPDDTDAEILAWLTAQQAVAMKTQELKDVRDRLLAHHMVSIRAAQGQGPPHLQNVVLRTPHIIYYNAGWQADSDANRTAEIDQEKLLKDIADQRVLIATIKQAWFDIAAQRLPIARDMHGRAKLLQTLAESYKVTATSSIVSNAIIDGAVGVAGVVFTGGVATLGAKIASVQDDLAAKHAKSLASFSDDTASRSLHLLGYPAHRSPLLRLNEASRVGAADLTSAYVELAKEAAQRQGGNVEQAASQAAKEIRYMMQRIHVDKRLREAAVDLGKRVRLEKELGKGVAQTLTAGYSDYALQHILPSGIFDTRSSTGAVVGIVVADGLGAAAQLATSAYAGRRANLPSVTTWAAQSTKLRRFQSLLTENGKGLALTAVGTVTKSLLTHAYQERLNQTVTEYWTEYAIIAFLGRILRQHQSVDQGIKQALVSARLDLARLQATYAAISSPPVFKAATDGYLPDPEGTATLTLTFSNGLTKAPTVKVAGQPIAMAPEGFATDKPFLARTFTGTLSFARLRDGAHVLEVALVPDTRPHARLDSDPTTVPILLSPALNNWRNVDDGPDRRHKIVMDLEVHRALGVLDGLIAKLWEGKADFEERYGSGLRDYDGGWTGMSKSLEQAHTRIGAPVQGDPNGIAWMRFNGLGLKSAAVSRYLDSVTEFREYAIARLAWQMDKRMDDSHRAYLVLVEERVGRWHEAVQPFHALGDEWLETLATFTNINAMADQTEAQRLTTANHETLAAIEAEIRAYFPEPLPRYEEWKAAQAAKN